MDIRFIISYTYLLALLILYGCAQGKNEDQTSPNQESTPDKPTTKSNPSDSTDSKTVNSKSNGTQVKTNAAVTTTSSTASIDLNETQEPEIKAQTEITTAAETNIATEIVAETTTSSEMTTATETNTETETNVLIETNTSTSTEPASSPTPSELSEFSAVTGNLPGQIKITIGFPIDTAGYSRVDIKRIPGISPPEDCNAGALVKSLSNFSNTILIDSENTPYLLAGNQYSYRACIYDSQNNEVVSHTIEAVMAMRHIIFVSSVRYSATLGGLVGADQKCQNLADATSLNGNWKALLSDQSTHAANRINVDGEFYNLSGIRIAINKLDLFDGSLVQGVVKNELGLTPNSTSVFTGTTTTGMSSGFHCANWTARTSITKGSSGNSSRINGRWLNDCNRCACDVTRRVYCFNDVP